MYIVQYRYLKYLRIKIVEPDIKPENECPYYDTSY